MVPPDKIERSKRLSIQVLMSGLVCHGLLSPNSVWDGGLRRIPVDEAETVPVIGMSLLEGSELSFQIRPGGNVTVRALLQSKDG